MTTKTDEIKALKAAMAKMQTELKEDMVKLQTSDRLKTEFLSMVSHELRTPITPIRGYVSLLCRGKLGTLNKQQKEALEVINRQSAHLEELIENLLDISRIELGKPIPTKMEPLNIKELIESAAQAEKITLQNHNLKLKLDINKKLPRVLGDKSKLKRVLTNLIGNAIKFAKEKDEIRIRVLKEGTFVRIEIIDHGLGLDPGNLEKIFEKFFQVDSSPTRNTQGIGMGLAIARDLIELHNGKIWAESKGLKQGTAIILLLPTINENIY